MLVQVTAPHFCAGLVVSHGKVTHAAPILKGFIGKRWDWVQAYMEAKRWKITTTGKLC